MIRKKRPVPLRAGLFFLWQGLSVATIRRLTARVPQSRTWVRLAGICGQDLGKGQLVSLEGRLQTPRWEDDRKIKHYRTEIVASNLEMLSGRRKKDYAAETAPEALESQAEAMGLDPAYADDFLHAVEAVDPEDAVPVAA